MTILIDLGSQLMSEAIYQFLMANGYDNVVVSGRSPADGFTPQVILVDITTVRHTLLSRYPEAKVLLIDTGVESEKLLVTLLSHPIQGLLSTRTEMPLLKKALKAIAEGQIWIDNELVKTLLQDTGALSKTGKINGISGREQEIIACVSQGLSNKQIADRLALSENTVKAHLNTIFKKLNITSRVKLMALAVQSPLAGVSCE
ncbi:MAG: response regulator transcription factor [Syntrophorhabdales bacterium]|jgi:DNA-binding NarL/FixJ family response regulator